MDFKLNRSNAKDVQISSIIDGSENLSIGGNYYEIMNRHTNTLKWVQYPHQSIHKLFYRVVHPHHTYLCLDHIVTCGYEDPSKYALYIVRFYMNKDIWQYNIYIYIIIQYRESSIGGMLHEGNDYTGFSMVSVYLRRLGLGLDNKFNVSKIVYKGILFYQRNFWQWEHTTPLLVPIYPVDTPTLSIMNIESAAS